MIRKQNFFADAGVRAAFVVLTVVGVVWAMQSGPNARMQQQEETNPPPILVASADDAYLVGAPEFVCGAGANDVKASPGGRYALVGRMRPLTLAGGAAASSGMSDMNRVTSIETQLLLWDSRRATTRTVWRGQMSMTGGGAGLSQVEWLGKSGKAIVVLNTVTSNPRGNQIAAPNESEGDEMSRQQPLITARFHLFNAATGSLAPIPNIPTVSGDAMAMLGLKIAPTAPYAVVDTTDFTNRNDVSSMDKLGNPTISHRTTILNTNGNARTLAFPPGSHWLGPYWSKNDPETMYIWQTTVLTREKIEGQRYDKTTREQLYHSVNLRTGLRTKLAEKPKDLINPFRGDDDADGAQIKSLADIALVPTTVTVNEVESAPPTSVNSLATTQAKTAAAATEGGKSAAVPPVVAAPVRKELSLLYLRGKSAPPEDLDKNRVLLAADAKAVALLPDASAVFYSVRGGSLFAVPLTKVNRAEMLAMRRAADKATTMRNAKQVGTGMIMYAMDYDEIFPHDTAGVPTSVQLYLKNDKVFQNPTTGKNGFTYLLASGQSLAKIDKPAETRLGYIQGPGGRAIIFTDGHVVWEDDAPPRAPRP